MSKDLVRIEAVRRDDQERFIGAVGLLMDTDIDDNGRNIFTVYLLSHDMDVQCRDITIVSRAERVNGNTQ